MCASLPLSKIFCVVWWLYVLNEKRKGKSGEFAVLPD